MFATDFDETITDIDTTSEMIQVISRSQGRKGEICMSSVVINEEEKNKTNSEEDWGKVVVGDHDDSDLINNEDDWV